MIYQCTICSRLIPELRTPGDEVNKDLICPTCAQEVHGLIKEAKKIQVSLLQLFGKSN